MDKKIMKYNPAFLTDQELIDSFAVRHAELEVIVETIRENTGNANQHILLIGPRGIGKTMLALRAVAEVRRDEQLNKQWYPIVYGEESYQVCSAGEFWLEAIFYLAEQTKKERWQITYQELKEEKDEKRLQERALGQLLDFAREEKKRILLVVENLNMIFDEQVKEEDGWALRQVLQNRKEVMLLGTATRRFEEVEGIDRAMFDLFKDQQLQPLVEKECKQLWKLMTGKRTTSRKIRPIQILTGGNPRLLAIIINFAIHTSFRDLMNDLIRLIDEHTEYFKNHLDGFAATERKVFVALMDLWDPSSAREVSEAARMEVSKTSALLNRLVDRGVVMVIGAKGRKKNYQTSERLYNIYHLMRRRGITFSRVKVIVKFMIMFYEPNELAQKVKLIAKEAIEMDPDERKDHLFAIKNLFESELPPDVTSLILQKIPDMIYEMPEAPIVIHAYKLRERFMRIGNLFEEFQNKDSLSESEKEFILESLKSIIKKDKRNIVAYIILILLLKSERRTDEVNKFSKDAMKITPNNIVEWLLISSLIALIKNYDGTENIRSIILGGYNTNSNSIYMINSYFALLYTFIHKKYSLAYSLFCLRDDYLQKLLNGLEDVIFEINKNKEIIDTDNIAVFLSLRDKWEKSLDLMKSIISKHEYVKTNIDNINTFFLEATRAGYGKDALDLLRGTPAEAVLEPLVVGIERYLGLDTRRRAQEIEEIAEDVKKRIEKRKREYEKKEKEKVNMI